MCIRDSTEIPAGGFDACPYTAATWLRLNDNDITAVGARAFANLAALTWLSLQRNAITWMAPTSLDGLTRLRNLHLHDNRLRAFDYGVLAPMAALRLLWPNDQEGGDLSCGGKDYWNPDAAGIAAVIASCGAASGTAYVAEPPPGATATCE